MRHGRIRWATDGLTDEPRSGSHTPDRGAGAGMGTDDEGQTLVGTRLIEAARAAAALHMAQQAQERARLDGPRSESDPS